MSEYLYLGGIYGASGRLSHTNHTAEIYLFGVGGNGQRKD